jgi:hypothetical protein
VFLAIPEGMKAGGAEVEGGEERQRGRGKKL